MIVTAIFDIGKTNKKFLLFDEQYAQVYQSYSRFPEIKDEDGFPCDDIAAISQWIQSCLKQIISSKKFQVKAINFSSYGASLIHLDRHGNPVTPLYNYLKPIPEDVLTEFYNKYGDRLTFGMETASPPLGMLNSGLQLYWLKVCRPKTFRKIKWTLHLPQYLSYLLTKIPLSEFTSIGSHTGLWDYNQHDYHRWVKAEGLERMLPPIVNTGTSIYKKFGNKGIRVGVGIHDSSASLIPYLHADEKPFLLVSTGTWSISLNPFWKGALTKNDLENDCLNFLQVDGSPVRAARLFLGNEYKHQIGFLSKYYGKKKNHHRKIKLDVKLIEQLEDGDRKRFHFESLPKSEGAPSKTDLSGLPSFKAAYHQLMLELMTLQLQAIQTAIEKTQVKKIYIDGGFAENDLFTRLIARHFSKIKIRTTHSPLGSALGAALVVADQQVGKKFLKKHYALKKL